MAEMAPQGAWWSYDSPQWTTTSMANMGDALGNFKYQAFNVEPLNELVGCVGGLLPADVQCDATLPLPVHCVSTQFTQTFPSALSLFGSGRQVVAAMSSFAGAGVWLTAFEPFGSTECRANQGGINIEG